MSEPILINRLRQKRSTAGLSQHDLAERLGVSRQAIVAIEAGRQVPSTLLALGLARALGCAVDDLFQLASGPIVLARLAEPLGHSTRVVMGRIDGRLAAHRLHEASRAADGLLVECSMAEETPIELLTEPGELDTNLLVAGCAPLLGTLSERLGRRYRNARATWIFADSSHALDLLKRRLVHIAGIHWANDADPEAHVRAAREVFPGERTVLVNLARWRQGLVLPPGNPLGLTIGPELFQKGVKHALREPGSGARRVFDRIATDENASASNEDRVMASDHAEVARLIHQGLADVGIAIESVALDTGLDFIPISEERFDLIVPEPRLETPVLSRFLDLIDRTSFRAEVAHLPGYDLSQAGHASTVEA